MPVDNRTSFFSAPTFFRYGMFVTSPEPNFMKANLKWIKIEDYILRLA